MTKQQKQQTYRELFQALDALCEGERDPIALMATISCELFQRFELFHWVGFYRNIGNDTLKIGPYQGGHGCLTIPFSRGICGQCARERSLLNIPDVLTQSCHIACSTSTRSELVLPIINQQQQLLAVLDIDSDLLANFDEIDEQNLQQLNRYFNQVPAANL
ncbi:GAF domain-containing protein [Dongshaea marina]|uniref:GAF domain-containing protein n=1 Tax=Dongshaea marina TaxID=2047966 RepID=UPI000D3E4464|nr:GAF domain-containing protein [Dongshaea marina]